MNNSDITKRRKAIAPRGVGIMCDFYADRAENATLWDVEGNKYTDFACGIAVMNTGHRHPALVRAMQEQLERFTHTAYQVIPYESYVSLAERVAEITPISGPKKTAFFTTGAEAVENAVKIARAYTGRHGVIAFSGAFHGRTNLGMALTGKVVPYKTAFGPFPSDIYHVPFPSEMLHVSVAESIAAIERLFKADIEASRVAAIIFEPVQGEGGFYIIPKELVIALRKICDKHGILLIADEVQSGFARTGKMFAMEHYGVEADIVTMAKSLAGGMPLSGVCGRADVMDGPAPGGLGGTYAGNPLAIAASHAVIDTIQAEGLCERSAQLGQQLMTTLEAERKSNPAIAEVRGLGSMVAAEFCDPKTGEPSPEITNEVQRIAMSHGLILLTCGVYANVIRFLYPLTIPQEQFDAALEIIKLSIREASRMRLAA
ncbi:4-aminobutyrate--2-oxoglutarate transaminase [Zwartia vadi]|uniref:4-aminobutyrate--2-oxoglutarate transaminase n=1 Tax=Zwartia vadi TaxID=3058168 RepID=UPI0025B52BEC|nr:4-aminobutyrate--2-oxoglutarate transaminase [Zwartia vadi]MDN3986576.1 4-aminobutyrate--2-oxoglutarate transaminase [Zwartia vadi]